MTSLADIHDVAFEERVLRQTKDDLARFSKSVFALRACPACGADRSALKYSPDGFNFHECIECTTLYLNPCPNDEQIVEFLNSSEGFRMWREDMPQETIDRRQRMYKERADLVISLAGETKYQPTVLEVGAGNGYLAKHLIAHGFRYIGIEPQPLPEPIPGAEIIIASFQSSNVTQTADIVCAFEVFEHLTDPYAFLKFAYEALRPGGRLIMSTPNSAGYETKMLGTLSHAVLFDHVALYTPQSIRMMLDREGFLDVQITTPGRFDVDLVRQAAESGDISLTESERAELHSPGFQERLQQECRSSHMRIVATKPD